MSAKLFNSSTFGVIRMQNEIGTTAGLIWNTLDAKGTLSLSKLKRAVGCKTPVFDWALGWLAREDKIVITCEGRTAGPADPRSGVSASNPRMSVLVAFILSFLVRSKKAHGWKL